MAKSTINWPKSLPPGLQAGRSYRRQSPNERSKMASGRAIQRRVYPGAPWYGQISWLMSDVQAQAFMGWARDVLMDCNYWFNSPLRTPLGYGMHSVRIVDHYDGPSMAGPGLWSFSAEVEFDDGPLIPVGEGEFPDDVVQSSIFDLTMNKEWPTNE